MKVNWLEKDKLRVAEVEIDLRGRKALQQLLKNFTATPGLTLSRREILFGKDTANASRPDFSERYVRCKVHSTVKLISRTRKFLAAHFHTHPTFKNVVWMPYDEKKKHWVLYKFKDESEGKRHEADSNP